MPGLFSSFATGNAPEPQQQQQEPQAPQSFADFATGGTEQEPERDSEGFFGTVLDTLGFSDPQNDFMAVGKTPKGEAYYGEGLGGWARRTFAKFMDPAKRDEGLSDVEKQHAADWARTTADEWAARNPNLASYKDYYSAWVQASALDKTRAAKGEGVSVALGEAGNVIKTGLVDVGIMGVLQLGDIGMRKVLAAGEGVDDIANTSSNLPSWSPFEQQKQWIRDNIPGGDGFLNVADNFDPIGSSWNLIRYSQSQFEKGDVGQGILSAALSPVALLSGPIGQGLAKGLVGGAEYLGSDAQEKAIVAKNLQASNMLYTQMWDPLVKAEIMRRLESGEPVTFVEEALVNPWAELGGSLALDPLNLIGAGEAKHARLLDKANEVTQVLPEIKGAMEALGKLDDVADPQIVKKGLQALTDSVTAAFKSDQLKQTYGAMSLTANGNRFVLGRELGGWLKNLVGMHLDDTDQAAAMVQRVADLSVAVAQGDEAAKLDALTWLSRAPGGEQVFTARGQATMAVFERLLQKTDEAGKVIGHDSPAALMKRLLDAAKEGKTAGEQTEILAAKAGELMDKALEGIFPTVSDIKKLDPKAYDALPGYVKAANDLFSRDSNLGALYAKANGFFSNIYMGLSPAFVLRNGLTNTISIMVDQGLKAGVEAQVGQVESFFRPGAIHQRAVDDLTKIFGSLPKDLLSSEGLAKEVGSNFGVLGRNARVEQTGRALLMRNAAAAELERAYRTGLPGIEALTKGGFSEAQVGYLMDAIRSERGVQAGVKKFVEYLGKTGGVVEPQKLVQMPAKMRGFLRQLGLETVVDGLRQGDYATADEFRAAAQKVLDDITQYGNKAKNELSTVSPDSPGVDVVKNVAQGLKGEQGQALTDVFGHMVNTFDNARYAAADAIKKFLGAQEQAGVPVSDAYNAVLDTLNGPEGKVTKTALMDHLQMIRDMVPKAKRGELPVADLLNKLKFNINGEVFDITKLADTAGITADNVGDVIWTQYWPSVSAEAWGRLNHNQYAALENIVTRLGGDPAILGPARDLMAEGFRFQDIVVKSKADPNIINQALSEAEQFAGRPYVRSATQHGLTGAIMEQLPGLTDEFTKWVDSVSSQFGKVSSGKPTTQLDMAALERWTKEAANRDALMKQNALEVARAQADFALHAYGDKTYLDAGMAFIYPYHYWYGRTYKNWMERLIQKPGIIAAYGKYRRTMEQLHAGMPDWWKYNLSTNDLPGIETDNPLYFNLEATLNPLNGLTGTDFEDSKKRVDWLSRTVDDMGKFGPSMFSPISWLMAAKLYSDGQNEAASRWMGRMLPQSSFVKAVGAQVLGKNVEIDPFVNLFQGGLDPYERGRVGRALAAMVQDGSISPEQSIDAGNSQSGPVWEQAVLRATQLRAPGQIASFIGGVGFKGRTKEDIEVDNFYTEYYQVMGAAPNMPPDTFREAMALLERRYPFMSTVLISRRADDDRNSAYAYNVLSRIPPGQSSDLLKKVGISTDMIGRFYDSKGTFKGWTQQDISRFMAGVGDMGALFAIPDYATKSEWNDARNAYGGMTTAMKQQFGPDILDKIDVYYSLPKEKQGIYTGQHPEISAALNFKSQSYSTDPLLYKYYGGIEAVEKFYKSQMYAELEKKYGKDISAKWDEYYNLQLSSTSQAKAYYRSHPELAGYSKEKAKWNEYILKASARVAAMMPDTTPGIQMRPDAQPSGEAQQNLAAAMQPQQEPSWQEWQGTLSEPLQRLVLDYWLNDRKLSSSAESQLNYMAPKYGYQNGDDLLQALGASIYRAQQTQQSYQP